MNKSILVGCACFLGSALPFDANGSVHCTLSGFRIDAYHHAGTYLHGYRNGVCVNFLNICGETSGAQNVRRRQPTGGWLWPWPLKRKARTSLCTFGIKPPVRR